MPPPINTTIAVTKTFRYSFSNVAEKYTFSAVDLRTIIAAGASGATTLLALAVSWRLRSVNCYFSPSTANLGRLDFAADLRFAAGSGALDDDTKVVDRVESAYGGSVPSHLKIVPPRNSANGFWHNETASGEVFTLAVPAGLSGVLDITLDLIMGSNVEAGAFTVTSSSAFNGIKQRGIFGTVASTFLFPIGMPNYVA